MRRLLASALIVLGLAFAQGQDGLAALAQRNLSERASISLLTMWPGREVYIAFGHSAFRVRDPSSGLDMIFNYGTFDFEDPLFVPRFVLGDLRYYLDAYPFKLQFDYDRAFEKRIWVEQILDLDQDQTNALFQFLVKNLCRENRYYRYDFIADNCSTRIRDALSSSLGDSVIFSEAAELRPNLSFRRMIDQYVVDRPLWRFAFFLVLGRSADREVTAREAVFLPQYLLEALDGASIARDRRIMPLVKSKGKILDPSEPGDYSSRLLDPAFILWPAMLLALGLALFRLLKKKGAVSPRPWRILDFAFFLLLGLVGVIIVFLDFLSVHSATKGNLNVLWLLPTHAIAAFFILRAPRWRFLPWYFLIAALPALAMLLTWPIWPQDIYLTMLPAVVLVVLRSWAVFQRLRLDIARPGQVRL